MRPHKLISLTVAAAVASATASAAGALAAGTLSGSGSTLVAPLEVEWAQAFKTFYGITVEYTPSGSQTGVQAISSRDVDFGASDAPMTATQVSACHGCYQIPWALTAIGVGYNVSGAGAKLRLTGPVLAGIYLGQITRWNDAKIQSLNPKLKLPALKITPIYSNGSGDTYAFTNYLSDVSSSWRTRAGIGTTVGFPTGVAANSNSAITARLESTSGAIAYAGVSYLIAHSLPAAAIQNAASNYEYPNLSNIESAARAVKHVPSNDVLRIVDPPSSARSSYPISTLTYAIVPANSTQKPALKQWILTRWALVRRSARRSTSPRCRRSSAAPRQRRSARSAAELDPVSGRQHRVQASLRCPCRRPTHRPNRRSAFRQLKHIHMHEAEPFVQCRAALSAGLDVGR